MKQFKPIYSLLLLLLFVCTISAQSIKYQKYNDEAAEIKELASKYKSICSVIDIGKSAGGRNIYALEIGTGDNKLKPALLVLAGVDTDDLAGPVAAKNFAESILSKADADSVKTLLAKFTLYIIPRLSPDPLEGFFEKVKAVHVGNDMKIDQDKDGAVDEDGYNDLDANSLITLMRVLDPAGEYIENTEDIGLLKKADTKKGEFGKYILLTEGLDDDKDGKINEDPAGGINVNKNATYNFKPYTFDGGMYPFQAAELRALGDFVFERPNILALFTFNAHNNILDAWKIRNPQSQQPQQAMGQQGGGGQRGGFGGNMFQPDSIAFAMMVKEIAPLSKYKGDAQQAGDIPGWAFYDAGRLSFCMPAWTYPELRDTSRARQQQARPQMQQDAGRGMQAQAPQAQQLTREQIAYRWIKKNAPQLFIDWKEYKHPDFPNNKVEIGGLAPFAVSNPPEDSLKTVTANANKLLYKLFKSLPDLNVETPLVEPVGNGVNRVTITISNKGKLPTHTMTGRRVKSLQSLLIRTALTEGQKIVSGKVVTFIDEPLQGGGKITRTLLIVGKGKVEFKVGSASAGFKTVSVQL